MFDNLLESKPKKQRTVGQTIVSLAIHGLLIFGAIKATQGVAEEMANKPIDTTMVFLKPPEPVKQPEPPPPEDVVVSANPPPKGFQTVIAPTDIPKDIPPIDLNQKPFDPKDFTGKGIEGGVASGVVGGTGPVDLNTVVTSAEADEQPQLLSAGPKRTPPGMEGVPARVQFEFIVDTLGRAESRSIKVLNSTNKLFEEPAREMVLKSVFKPGRQGGRPVRVLVTQAVTFQ